MNNRLYRMFNCSIRNRLSPWWIDDHFFESRYSHHHHQSIDWILSFFVILYSWFVISIERLSIFSCFLYLKIKFIFKRTKGNLTKKRKLIIFSFRCCLVTKNFIFAWVNYFQMKSNLTVEQILRFVSLWKNCHFFLIFSSCKNEEQNFFLQVQGKLSW